MIRILVTGASGMLGSYLANYLKADYDVYAAGNSYFDQQFEKYLKFDLKSNCYKELINWSKPEFVVHCAAMTNGNECEKNPQVANLVNGYSVKKLCSSLPSETTIIYISSDAVFSPSLVMANEENEPKPESSYGKSKLLGENYLNDSLQNYYIIRTTIVGTNINRNKKSFVDWIIDSSLNRKTISLFDDVIFNPIAIWDLCCELKFIIESKIDPGTYHISGSEPISKFRAMVFGLLFSRRFRR